MSWVCEKCGDELDTHEQYKNHRVDHQLGKIEDVDPVERDTGVPTRKPGDPLPQAVDEEPLEGQQTEPTPEHIDAPALDKTPKSAKVPPWNVKPKKQAPMRLVYHFEGTCQTCGSDVETLTLDDLVEKNKKTIKSKQVVVAWCPNCKKQKRQRQVAKL